MPKRFYITTPIYYVNSVPHLGTTLTTVLCDIVARYERMRGKDVFLLTGTDENGLKVKEAALALGKQPQAFVDEISQSFLDIFRGMEIQYDDFIRTTEKRHFDTVQEAFRRLQEKGYIYVGKYEGWYDVSTETFYKESDLVDGKSPEGNEVRWVSEDNYFFKLSAFQDRLVKHINENPDFIIPEIRRNEVLGFIKQGLRDASISRVNDGWGVPIPGDESRVVYVWFDALLNYISATGWPNGDWQSLWPADLECMGKDILTRFHATLWPAILMGLDLPLPKTLVGHAWLLMGSEKMAKSKGNVVGPLDLAAELSDRAGCDKRIAVDAVRYYMASSLPYENDATYTSDEFYKRYNSDLANDLGNALNRSLAMASKFVDGKVPDAPIEAEAEKAIADAKSRYEESMERYRVDHAAEAALELIKFLNKYIDTRAPWALAKNGDAALGSVIASMLGCLSAAAVLFRPILPTSADYIEAQLGISPAQAWEQIGSGLKAGAKLGDAKPIFPRVDLSQERGTRNEERGLSGKKERENGSKGFAAANLNAAGQGNQKTMENQLVEKAVAAEQVEDLNGDLITIDAFAKVKLKVGRVLEAEPVENSDKLMKLQVIVGGEKRQIVAGIRATYQPLDLIGRQVIVVFNLKPAKLRGVESQGMLLAAVDENGGAILLQPEKEAPDGSIVR